MFGLRWAQRRPKPCFVTLRSFCSSTAGQGFQNTKWPAVKCRQCNAMLWTENSNEHPKTRTCEQQKHDIEIPQNRLVWSGSRLMIVQNGWIFSICEIYWEYGTAGHLVFWKPWPAVELKKVLSVKKTVSSSEPSVNQTLDLRSIKHFRITCLV